MDQLIRQRHERWQPGEPASQRSRGQHDGRRHRLHTDREQVNEPAKVEDSNELSAASRLLVVEVNDHNELLGDQLDEDNSIRSETEVSSRSALAERTRSLANNSAQKSLQLDESQPMMRSKESNNLRGSNSSKSSGDNSIRGTVLPSNSAIWTAQQQQQQQIQTTSSSASANQKPIVGDEHRIAQFAEGRFTPNSEFASLPEQANEDSQMHLQFALSSLVLLFVAFIIYKWFYRRQSWRSKTVSSLIDSWPGSLLPSKLSGSRFWRFRPENLSSSLQENNTKEYENDDGIESGREKNGAGLRQQSQSKPTNSSADEQQKLAHLDPDAIQVEESIAVEQPGKKSRLGTMVILKRRLAGNAFFVATTKSIQPKIGLLRSRMRDFIDDEAARMREKQSAGPEIHSWPTRIFAHTLSVLKSNKQTATPNSPAASEASALAANAADSELVEMHDMKLEANDDEPLSSGRQSSASRQQVVSQLAADNEARQQEAGSEISNLQYAAPNPSALTPIPSALANGGSSMAAPNGGQLKPSLSPILIGRLSDAYTSSISGGCSLLSPSPLGEQHHLTGSAAANLAPTTATNAASCGCHRLTIGSELASMPFRSKSQGHSPNQPNSGHLDNHHSASPTANPLLPPCRPCCSVSPSNQLGGSRSNEQPSCYHHHHHHQHQHNQPHNHYNHAHHPLPEEQRARANHIGDQSSLFPMKHQPDATKCSSSRMRRQYENYYDDENEDAYRRLTATIGMEFGLNFDNHHHNHSSNLPHHHHHPSRRLNYAATTGHLDDLLNFNRLTCAPEAGSRNSSNPIESLLSQPGGGQQPCSQCKCCSQRSPTSFNQLFDGPDQQSNQILMHQQQQQQSQQVSGPNHEGQFFESHFYGHFKSTGCGAGGSAGELLSSASTSLGGSDSGFVMNANTSYLCRNPLCSCQTNNLLVQQQPHSQLQTHNSTTTPMSILVQQPSVASPSPHGLEPATCPGEEDNKEERAVNVKAEDQDQSVVSNEIVAVKADKNEPAEMAINVSTQQVVRAKWRHRRRLSHKRTPDFGCTANQICSNGVRVPRRMSIAGDRVSSVLTRQPNSAFLNGARDSQAAQSPAISHHLQHRASIAVDGSWQTWNHHQPANVCAQTAGNRHCWQQQQHFQQQQNRHLLQPLDFQPPPEMAHRPSDGFLYGDLYYVGKNSNCSSSGGSSSGIGVSGSLCTNTPTSAQPYGGSFALNKGDLSQADFTRLPLDPELGAYNYHPNHHHQFQLYHNSNSDQHHHHHHQCDPYQHLRNAPRAQVSVAGCQLGACPSRKFSLPVQLESQAAERFSPSNTGDICGGNNRTSRLLFEKNLKRVDSSIGLPVNHQSQRFLAGQQAAEGTNLSRQERVNRLVGLDSRRGSQSITRQSSFWLEDNSVDSVLSLATTSGFAGPQSEFSSQAEMIPLPQDERSPIFNNAERQRSQPNSQRPSISSLILSGDSIDSVKQRPLTELQMSTVDQQVVADQPERLPDKGEQSKQEFAPINRQSSDEHSSASPKESSSSASSTSTSAAVSGLPSSRPERGGGQHRIITQMRAHRLSSSSTTSSAGSSPSPDFSRPSERILALAPESSSISKRHLFGGRARSRRYTRFGQTNAPGTSSSRLSSAHNSIAGTSLTNFPNPQQVIASDDNNNNSSQAIEEANQVNPGATILSKEKQDGDKQSSQPNDDLNPDGDPLNAQNERSISDNSSASLERQCRELWKLRATLHDDSCVGDDWSNYHQRLNRRYDSGYKSIENQLSSSLEGNILAAVAAAGAGQRQQQQQQQPQPDNAALDPLLVRPQSGCSNAISRPADRPSPTPTCASDVVVREPMRACFETVPYLENTPSDSNSELRRETPIDSIDAKLADLELDEVALDCLIGAPVERDCQSRSSRSSNEAEEKNLTKTKESDAGNWS